MNQLFADRFRWARVLSGLSLQELANKLDNKLSRQALHTYEKGEVIPDSEMITILCNALHVRPDFFLRETEFELGHIEFRKGKKLPAKEKNRVIEQVKDKLSRYLELEEILELPSQFVNPLKDIGDIHSFEQMEGAAKKLRQEWHLGDDPIFNSIELLEDNYIKVIEVNGGSDGFDGMQTWVNSNIPVIAINKDTLKSHDRIRFTLLRELFHLLLPLQHLTEKQQEKLAHQFAAAMLLPAKSALEELGTKRTNLVIQELGALKKQYGISIEAIVRRAKDLEIVSDIYCKQFFVQVNQMGWTVNEPIEYQGVEESYRFNQLLFRAFAEELISMNKAAALNNQTVAEFRKKLLIIS